MLNINQPLHLTKASIMNFAISSFQPATGIIVPNSQPSQDSHPNNFPPVAYDNFTRSFEDQQSSLQESRIVSVLDSQSEAYQNNLSRKFEETPAFKIAGCSVITGGCCGIAGIVAVILLASNTSTANDVRNGKIIAVAVSFGMAAILMGIGVCIHRAGFRRFEEDQAAQPNDLRV